MTNVNTHTSYFLIYMILRQTVGDERNVSTLNKHYTLKTQLAVKCAVHVQRLYINACMEHTI